MAVKRVLARVASIAVASALCAATTTSARADEDPSQAAGAGVVQTTGMSILDRPHTIAVAEVGIIALPNAPISVANRGGPIPLGAFDRGDQTLQTSIHLLYRGARDWVVGATGLLAPRPSTDSSYEGPGATGTLLSRTHARSYLFLGVEGRYVPLRSRYFELWVGTALGAVIIADRFTTNDGERVPTILGTKEVTVRTEGFGLGVTAGADYLLSDQWVVGLGLRADRWLLPTTKSASAKDSMCSSIGDCPTISGTVEAFVFGLTIGYRILL